MCAQQCRIDTLDPVRAALWARTQRSSSLPTQSSGYVAQCRATEAAQARPHLQSVALAGPQLVTLGESGGVGGPSDARRSKRDEDKTAETRTRRRVALRASRSANALCRWVQERKRLCCSSRGRSVLRKAKPAGSRPLGRGSSAVTSFWPSLEALVAAQPRMESLLQPPADLRQLEADRDAARILVDQHRDLKVRLAEVQQARAQGNARMNLSVEIGPGFTAEGVVCVLSLLLWTLKGRLISYTRADPTRAA